MISGLSIAFMAVSLSVCFLVPVALTIYFYRKYKISLIAVLIGALVFTISQLVIRIPLLSLFGKQQWYIDMSSNIYVIALFLGLTAGLFEELGRYIAMRIFMKKSLSWKNGIAVGIGHGGIEAISLVGLTFLNYIIMSLMINSGVFDSMIASKLPADVAYQIKTTLANTPSSSFLAGGLERLMTMSIQIAFSVMVLFSVRFKKSLYLLYAILLHALVDSPLVVLGSMGVNVWIMELIVAFFGIAGLVYTIKAKDIFQRREQAETEAAL